MTFDSVGGGYGAATNYRHQANIGGGGDLFGGPFSIPTPSGIIHSTQTQVAAPPLPPRPNSLLQQQSPYSSMGGYGSPYGNSSFGGFGGGYNSGFYGMNQGMGFNSFGGGGFGYGRPSSFGNGNPMDPEMRFIQMAEESSRGAFQSIESIVSTIGNIATMLDSTYFALTSSFRAILGLAANFSHLRGFFGRFFSTFAVFKTMVWMYKKLLYMIGLSRVNPSTQINLNEAFKDAEGKINSNSDFFNASTAQQNGSGLAMVLFLTFIFTAPYLIMKLFGSLMNSTADQSKDPSTWINSIDAVVLYNFNGEHPSELSLRQGQLIRIAPKEVQQLNRLLSTNWLLATVDGKNCGLVPVNYIKRQEGNQIMPTNVNATSEIKPQQQPVIVNEEPVSIIKSQETASDVANDEEKSSVMV